MNTSELQRALMWGIGLGLGFAAAGFALGIFRKLA